jgi:hypothetical protein
MVPAALIVRATWRPGKASQDLGSIRRVFTFGDKLVRVLASPGQQRAVILDIGRNDLSIKLGVKA